MSEAAAFEFSNNLAYFSLIVSRSLSFIEALLFLKKIILATSSETRDFASYSYFLATNNSLSLKFLIVYSLDRGIDLI